MGEAELSKIRKKTRKTGRVRHQNGEHRVRADATDNNRVEKAEATTFWSDRADAAECSGYQLVGGQKFLA